MTSPNHIAGGYVFTGFFASILGLNFLSDPRFLPVIFFAALLPDIDHPKSILGRIFFPISKWIHRKYGHRTITHSLAFLLLTTFIVRSIQISFFPDFKITLLYFLAVSSHLIFDMVTVQGIPLFYPFLKNPCVLPADPRKRIRTNNIRHETIALSVFICSAVFLQPLFENGFWTQYNRTFGTLRHLNSEFHKSKDLLEVKFARISGSITDTITALVVASERSYFVGLNKDEEFHYYPEKGQRITDIYPSHTHKFFAFKKEYFDNISADSLNIITHKKKIKTLDFSCTTPANISYNSYSTTAKKFKHNYINSFSISELPFSKAFISNENQINNLKNQIINIKSKFKSDLNKYNLDLEKYTNTKSELENEKDIVKREINALKYSNIRPPKKPTLNQDKISSLQSKISDLQHENKLNLAEYQENKRNATLKISGFYEEILIESSPSFSTRN